MARAILPDVFGNMTSVSDAAAAPIQPIINFFFFIRYFSFLPCSIRALIT